MCGRFALYSSPARIRKQFAILNELLIDSNFNIMPSQQAMVIRCDEKGRRISMYARWGLTASCEENSDELQQPPNAKAETAAIEPMLRNAYRKSRILIPADVFYEWTPRHSKQPYLFKLKDESPMGLGGLLESWHNFGTNILTFTILTTRANLLIAGIHDRMPVIIKPEDYATWLDNKLTDIPKLQACTQPYPDRLMEACPVSHNFNVPKLDFPDLIRPAGAQQTHLS